jgi:hypothetical protein
MVGFSEATAQPLAKSEKLCQEGAGKRPGNNPMTNIPNDDTTKVSTAMSSNKTVTIGT